MTVTKPAPSNAAAVPAAPARHPARGSRSSTANNKLHVNADKIQPHESDHADRSRAHTPQPVSGHIPSTGELLKTHNTYSATKPTYHDAATTRVGVNARSPGRSSVPGSGSSRPRRERLLSLNSYLGFARRTTTCCGCFQPVHKGVHRVTHPQE